MVFLCFFLAFPLITFLCTLVWIGTTLRIRGAFRRFEEGEQVLDRSQLGTLNVLSALVAGAGGLLGIGPFVVIAWVLIQEPYLDGYMGLALIPPGGSAIVGAALMAGGLVSFALNASKIAELDEPL